MKIKTSSLALLGLLGATPLLAERLVDASNAPEALWIALWGIGLISFSRALRARLQSSSGHVTEQTRPGAAALVADVRPRVAELKSVSTRTPRSQLAATPRAAGLRDRLWAAYARPHHGLRGPGDSALTGGQAST